MTLLIELSPPAASSRTVTLTLRLPTHRVLPLLLLMALGLYGCLRLLTPAPSTRTTLVVQESESNQHASLSVTHPPVGVLQVHSTDADPLAAAAAPSPALQRLARAVGLKELDDAVVDDEGEGAGNGMLVSSLRPSRVPLSLAVDHSADFMFSSPASSSAMMMQQQSQSQSSSHSSLAHCPPCPRLSATDEINTSSSDALLLDLARARSRHAAAAAGETEESLGEVPTEAPASPPPPPSEPHSSATISETVLLDSANPHPHDSTGSLFRIRGRGDDTSSRPGSARADDEYVLCSFTRVCAQNDRLLFVHHDPAQLQRWKEEWSRLCWKVPHWQQPPLCQCFHPYFQPDFLTPDQLAATELDGPQAQVFLPQHYWSVHKWSAYAA
jgi:hypothetical protein